MFQFETWHILMIGEMRCYARLSLSNCMCVSQFYKGIVKELCCCLYLLFYCPGDSLLTLTDKKVLLWLLTWVNAMFIGMFATLLNCLYQTDTLSRVLSFSWSYLLNSFILKFSFVLLAILFDGIDLSETIYWFFFFFLQPPLWERYQQQLKDWEQAMSNANLGFASVGQEKPPMSAFCLKPRGLEVPNKGSKQRSHRKISVSGHSHAVPRDQDGLHPFGTFLTTMQTSMPFCLKNITFLFSYLA